MDSVKGLKSAWIFDKKGTLKETKNKQDEKRAQQVLLAGKEALRCAPTILEEGQKIKRIAFININKEWIITTTPTQDIIIMQKQDQN